MLKIVGNFQEQNIELGVETLNKDSFFSLINKQLFFSAHTFLKCNNPDVKLHEDASHFSSVMFEADLMKSVYSYADSACPSFEIMSWITYFKRN